MNTKVKNSRKIGVYLSRMILTGLVSLMIGLVGVGQISQVNAEGLFQNKTDKQPVGAALPSAAPPTNDNYPGKTISSLPFNDLNVDTSGATTDINDPTSIIGGTDCDSNQGEASVWYNYNPGSGIKYVHVDTIGSNYDTVLAIWAGTSGHFILVACNDDISLNNLQSEVTFTAQANTNYYLEIISFTQPAPHALAGGILNFHANLVQPSLDSTGVFRPSNGLLYLKNTNTSGYADIAINYGTGGDYPVTGDWDGNGTDTIGIYRNGSFYLRNSNTVGFANLVFPFGTPGDQPIAGDWNGDGIDTIGVYRPSTGQFLLRNSNTAGPAEMSFYLGNVGDVGIAGDWNGDGIDTTGVFRPSNGVIFLKNTNATGFADIALNYGLPGDQPVMGDWNNDGIDTIGIYRNGTFYLRNFNTNGFANIVFALGNPGDMPIAGNWDGLP
jgi:hypothetical protein